MTKGKRAGDGPIAVEVEKDKSYYWCSCGKSSKQPFCDALIKELNLTQSYIKLKKLKKSFFVHANKQIINLFVMDHIIKSNIEIINLLTTSKS
jgi:CDGSH-type Zn-finger protein